MKKIVRFNHNMILLVVCVMLFANCKKNNGAYDYVNRASAFNGSTYDYLVSKPGVFDSLLFVVNKLGLTDSLKKNKVTLFAVTNTSFQQVVSKLNISRKLLGLPPMYLNDVKTNLLDSMMCRYIIRDVYIADSLAFTDGVMLKGIRYNYPMNAKLSTANATGEVGGGPGTLVFSDTKKSLFKINWVSAIANSINIRTNNGIVHILESTHPFGFGEYTKPVPIPFDKSSFRPAGYSGPFFLPSSIGATTTMIAQDFDLGGEGVAYHDNDANQRGPSGAYRPNAADQGVDLDKEFATLGTTLTDAAGTYPASYSIGYTVAGEWLMYSVYAPVEGDYTVTSRVGNGNATNPLGFHIEFDSKNVTGTLTYPNNKGWWVWQLVTSPKIHLTAGNHLMRFFYETNDVQLCNFVFKRIN